MKVLVYGDLQATDGHQRCYNNPSLPLQLWRVSRFYDLAEKIFVRHKCQALWDAGDLTDDRSSIPIPAIAGLIESLERFKGFENNLKVVGNHEQFLRDTTIHVGKLFTPFFQLVEETAVKSIFDGRLIDGASGNPVILACSYPASNKAASDFIYTESLRAKRRGKSVIVLGHVQVIGCRMGSGLAAEGVPSEAFEHVDLGLLGHVHSRQRIKGTNTWYIGSPFQQDFGEADEDKFVAVVDLESLALEWVKISGFPEYRTVSFEQFKQLSNSRSEDRFKVSLASPKEAEEFFSHPLASRPEPIYSYELGESRVDGELQPILSGDEALREYVKLVPPVSRGIQVSDEELLDLGRQLLV
jgi:DNA repair exonuclease SbcCD nuclease subunit